MEEKRFKVGDRVKVVGLIGTLGNWKVGDTAIWKGNSSPEADREMSGYSMCAAHYEFELIGEKPTSSLEGSIKKWEDIVVGKDESKPMSKYQDLKERIERVTAWDKEADDILQEIVRNRMNQYHISIEVTNSSSAGRSVNIIHWNIPSDIKAEFPFTSQCEKLQAFKKALLWLLDHSTIKKDLVGQEVKIGTEKLIATIEGKEYEIKIQSPVTAQIIKQI